MDTLEAVFFCAIYFVYFAVGLFLLVELRTKATIGHNDLTELNRLREENKALARDLEEVEIRLSELLRGMD